ncbi:DUF979 domain-containing protein [Helicobacter sp. faydin-H17]|uniref:DUF979 domain-containing protein n=2 Tax=Helicobacter kayseriensis TaxID=2905877 RepID=UPI001E5890C3|nr:DUF979 domain-containing protein [Helicobacter kayseriensis]MCE3046971.1 DUF979 domain-containing protein [Helicobacter kayseriensis]MCE3048369.1 DUF979 domain-containing protein [Helicobacter kayseriensis]
MMLELMYILAGLVCICSGFYAFFDSQNPRRIGNGIFWNLFGGILIFGPHIHPAFVGAILMLMGVLTAKKFVGFGTLKEASQEYRNQKSLLIGKKIFIPALALGVIAFGIAQFTQLGGLVGLGIASVIALGLSLFYTREKVTLVPYESSRILQQMGPAVILPQLLGTLGALFSQSGVGKTIANFMGSLFPQGHPLLGVALYCVSMALFTMVMGNAFAAFAVITIGIGLPFVIALGGDPVIVGALGLSAGYCGTLMTPMAANFNIVPAMILEMKNKNGVILEQIPVAIALLLTHIGLMYILAF